MSVVKSDSGGYGAEAADPDLILLNSVGNDVSLQTDYHPTGDRGIRFETSTSGAKALLNTYAGSRTYSRKPAVAAVITFQGMFKLDGGMPSRGFSIVRSGDVQGTLTGAIFAMDTDGTIKTYDKTGTQKGTATTGAFSQSAGKHGLFIIDGKHASTVWIILYVNGALDTYFDTGLTWSNFIDVNSILYWGEYFTAGQDAGYDLLADDLFVQFANAASDGPWTKAPQQLRGVGLSAIPPAADGDVADWTPSAGSDHYALIDDLAAHDGDTTYVDTATEGAYEYVCYTAGNPIPSGKTPYHVSERAVIRLLGDGKFGARFQLRDESDNESYDNSYQGPSPSFQGIIGHLNRPAGGDWAESDFDLSGGVSKLQFGMRASPLEDAGPRLTSLGMEVWYEEDTLELVPSPNVTIEAAICTATALAPTVTLAVGVALGAALCTATALAPTATVSVGAHVTIVAVVCTATALTPVAAVSTGITLAASLATATALVPSATLSLSVTLAAGLSTATALAPAATVSAGVALLAALCTATAQAPAATLSTGVTLLAAVGTATALAPAASLSTGVTVLATVGRATALVPAATVLIILGAEPIVLLAALPSSLALPALVPTVVVLLGILEQVMTIVDEEPDAITLAALLRATVSLPGYAPSRVGLPAAPDQPVVLLPSPSPNALLFAYLPGVISMRGCQPATVGLAGKRPDSVSLGAGLGLYG